MSSVSDLGVVIIQIFFAEEKETDLHDNQLNNNKEEAEQVNLNLGTSKLDNNNITV